MLHINKYSTRNISLLSPFTKVGTVSGYTVLSPFSVLMLNFLNTTW